MVEPYNEDVSGGASSTYPHHEVTLELVVPNTSGTLIRILTGLNFVCGDKEPGGDNEKTFNFTVKNKTDNITIDSGTFCPITAQEAGLCNIHNILLSVGIILMQSGCLLSTEKKFVLERSYTMEKEWRGKTIEYKLWCENNIKELRIQARVATSVFQ